MECKVSHNITISLPSGVLHLTKMTVANGKPSGVLQNTVTSANTEVLVSFFAIFSYIFLTTVLLKFHILDHAEEPQNFIAGPTEFQTKGTWTNLTVISSEPTPSTGGKVSFLEFDGEF